MAVDALARALAAGKVPVTAYEMAVKAGYTGTEEQFAEDMGNSGTNAANAAASASAAAASAESVSASAAQIATNTDDISDLKTQIDGTVYNLVNLPIWECGSLHYITGETGVNKTRLRSGYVEYPDVSSVECDASHSFTVLLYDSNNVYQGVVKTNGSYAKNDTNLQWFNEFDLSVFKQFKYRFQLRITATPSAEISLSDADGFYFNVNRINRIGVVEERLDKAEDAIEFGIAGSKNLSSNDFESGTYGAEGDPVANPARIRTAKIPLLKGEAITITPGTICDYFVYATFDSSDNRSPNSNWLNTEQKLTVTDQTAIEIVFKSGSKGIAEIQPSDYDAAIVIETLNSARISALEDEAENDEIIVSVPESNWGTGGIVASTGYFNSLTTRISTKFPITYPQYTSCESENGYKFFVTAWDKNTGAVLGAYTTSNIFSTSGTEKWLNKFDLSQFPNYSFAITVARPDNTEEISVNESINCIFKTTVYNLTEDTAKIVGFDAKEILAEGQLYRGKLVVHPVEIKQGDRLGLYVWNITGDTSFISCTTKDNENKDYFINVNSLANKPASFMKYIIATSDANGIKLYGNGEGMPSAHYVVWRAVNGDKSTDASVQIFYNKKNIKEHGEHLNVLGDSNAYAMNGEIAIKNNLEYIDDKKLKIVMLDNNYKYFSISNIKSIIDAMAQTGSNVLMIGFGGSGRGLSFKLDNMTITSFGIEYDLSDCISTDFGSYYTETDMEEIITYANANNIEIIPSFNMPGHFAPFLVKNVQFRYVGTTDSINLNDPRARDYAYKIAEMYIKWFAERGIVRWHYGADEFNDGLGGYYGLYSAGNYNYALFINELSYIVTKYRMIPYAWNDAFGIGDTIEPMLNRKVPVLFWVNNTATQHQATAAEIKALGNPLINSSRDIYWVANGRQVTETEMRKFDVTKFCDTAGSTISNPAGACFCIWIGKRESPALNDGGDAITSRVLPLIRAFGETVTPQFA